MAIAEGPVLQQLPFRQEVVDLRGDLGTALSGLQQRHAIFMGGDVGFPDLAAGGIHLFHKHRPLQRRIIAADHRKTVQRQDIAALQDAARHRVMRAIGVQPGLEPDPGVAVFGIGKALGNLGFHRIAPGHRHVDLAHAGPDRLFDRIAAHVGHLAALPDQRHFGGALDHALLHRCRGNVDATLGLQEGIQLFRLQQRQVIRLAAHGLAGADDAGHHAPEIVALPVCVGDVVAMAAPPGLAGVNAGADRHAFGLCHHAGIGTPERAIEKARIIGHIVHRGQHHSVKAVQLHDVAQARQTVFIFVGAKGQHRFGAIVKAILFRAIQRHLRPHSKGSAHGGTPKGPGVQDDRRMFSAKQRAARPCGDAIATARAGPCRAMGGLARGRTHGQHSR